MYVQTNTTLYSVHIYVYYTIYVQYVQCTYTRILHCIMYIQTHTTLRTTQYSNIILYILYSVYNIILYTIQCTYTPILHYIVCSTLYNVNTLLTTLYCVHIYYTIQYTLRTTLYGAHCKLQYIMCTVYYTIQFILFTTLYDLVSLILNRYILIRNRKEECASEQCSGSGGLGVGGLGVRRQGILTHVHVGISAVQWVWGLGCVKINTHVCG